MYRLSKDTIAHFSSLDELRNAWQLKPVKRKPNSEGKLKKVQEEFCSHHKCKACGRSMSWMGGNLMTCTNPQCKGIKREREDSEGNKYIEYLTSYKILNDHFAEVAENIFT